MTTFYIYALIDPRDNQIKYIGQTTKIQQRYYAHCGKQKGHNHRSRWLNLLSSLDMKPAMKVIEECDDFNWAEREMYWIKYYREQGCNLVNATEGGEGITGWKHSEETKTKMRKAHKTTIRTYKLTEDRINKLREINKNNKYNLGRKASDETKEKQRKAKLGKCPSKETKQKISSTLKGRNRGHLHPIARVNEQQVRDIRYFLSMRVPAREIAKMYNISSTTVQNIKTGRNWGWLE